MLIGRKNSSPFKTLSPKSFLEKMRTVLDISWGVSFLLFTIAGFFVGVDQDEATELLDAKEEKLQEEIEALEGDLEKVLAQMTELKTKLYGKFKNSINLD